jgi:hypothetical protein
MRAKKPGCRKLAAPSCLRSNRFSVAKESPACTVAHYAEVGPLASGKPTCSYQGGVHESRDINHTPFFWRTTPVLPIQGHCAKRLAIAPAALWEYGSKRPEDRCACYLRMRVFTGDLQGHSAIHFRFNNNEDLPHREVSEFCIRTDPAPINRLGSCFGNSRNCDSTYSSGLPLRGGCSSHLKIESRSFVDAR